MSTPKVVGKTTATIDGKTEGAEIFDDVYHDIKRKLIVKGVPEKEIAFIHEADTEAKKAELFSKVKDGQVRFLLGSTAKMGAGTSVQDRIAALHHLDIGWKSCYPRKDVSGCGSIQIKAVKANYVSNQYRLEDDIAKNYPQQIALLKESIEGYQADITCFEANKITNPEKFVMEIGGKVFTEKKEAGTALLAVCKTLNQTDSSMDIGQYQGFSLRLKFDTWSKEFVVSLKNKMVQNVRIGSDELGNITRINNSLEGLPRKLKAVEDELETVKDQLQNAETEVRKPFPKETELSQMLERLSELNALLNIDEKGSAETVEADEQEERKPSIHDRLQVIKQSSGEQMHAESVGRKKAACIG